MNHEVVRPTETKRFRVKLLHGYFPEDPEHPKHPLTGGIEKVMAGEVWARTGRGGQAAAQGENRRTAG